MHRLSPLLTREYSDRLVCFYVGSRQVSLTGTVLQLKRVQSIQLNLRTNQQIANQPIKQQQNALLTDRWRSYSEELFVAIDLAIVHYFDAFVNMRLGRKQDLHGGAVVDGGDGELCAAGGRVVAHCVILLQSMKMKLIYSHSS